MNKLRITLTGLLLFSFLEAAVRSQSIDEYQFKAVFLYNVAKFVEWPQGAFKTPTDPIVCCILGEGPFGRSLEQAASSRVIEGRRFLMQHITDARQAASCHILFVSSLERKRWRSIIRDLKGRSILTVGETEDFTSEGGIINFKLEGEKARIQINVDQARQDRLKISSKLLGLSQIVK